MTLVSSDPEFWSLQKDWKYGHDYSRNPEYLRIKEALTDIMVKRLGA